jgi:hypothetical protein
MADLINGDDDTINVLKGMLTENTGTHFLDSGGASGRHWQRNQDRDFGAEPEVTYPYEGLLPRLNVFHWLSERLTFDSVKTAALRAFGERESLYGLQLAEAYVAECHKNAGGVYGDGKPFTVNTYNHECALSQTLQFVFFTVDDEAFVALQIHNGADVRGGYTDPQVFSVIDEGVEVLQFADAHWQCDECSEAFYTDNAGYRWYAHGGGDDFKGEDVTVIDGHAVCPACTKETYAAKKEK